MGFRFTDILETIAPIGVAMIPGVGIPAAIALSAAMKGGVTAAKGGSGAEILRDLAIGGATGAAGAGTAGLLSKGLGKAAGAATEKAGGKAAEKLAATAASKGGLSFSGGLPQIAYGAAGQGGLDTAANIMAKGATKAALLQKGADLSSGALGKDEEKTAAMLKTIKSGGRMVGAADDLVQAATPPPRFSQHTALAQQQTPGMHPKYQFGIHGAGRDPRLELGFGRFF